MARDLTPSAEPGGNTKKQRQEQARDEAVNLIECGRIIDETDRVLFDAIASLADAPEMMLKGADFRSDESIRVSRWAEINKWLERSVFEPVTREEAKASGGKIFGARWVDDAVKEKSRYVIQELAKNKDTNCTV